MDRQEKGESVGRMLDLIRRRELLKHNLSADEHWVEVGTEIDEASLRIEILLPGNRWSTPRELLTLPPVALRYESRLRRWNLDYMVEAFDAIHGRHSSILGPWITVTRTGDRRTYHGRDAWDMSRVASLFRTQHGLKPMRGREDAPAGEGGAGQAGEEIISVEIHSEVRLAYRGRAKDTVLGFRRDGDGFTEVVRFGVSPSQELTARILQNILWGRSPRPASVRELRDKVEDLVALLRPGGDGGLLGGEAAS